MKRIAYIIELAGTKRQGGEQIAMLQVASTLKKQGHKVDIYSYTNENPKFRIKSVIPLKIRLLPFIRDLLFLPLIGRSLLSRISKDYDVIVASSTTLSAFIRPKSNLILTTHIIRTQKFDTLSKIPEYKLFFNPITYVLFYYLEKLSLKNANKIIAIRDHHQKFLTERLKIDNSKISIIPNGVNTKIFRPLPTSKINQIIFVGRGTINKGLDTIIEAAPYINSEILIVTQNIDENLLLKSKSIKNISVKKNASPDELAMYYSQSKVFILPSIDDEFTTISSMEAMSCGLPIVVTEKAGGALVKNGINGYIIPERDPEALANSVNKLLKDTKLRNSIGTNNRNLILKNHNLETTTKETYKIFYE